MKYFAIFLAFTSICFASQIPDITFDDSTDLLSSEKLAYAFNEATNSILKQANGQLALSNEQLLPPTSIIPDEIPWSFNDEPSKCSRYYKPIVQPKKTRKNLNEILEKNKQKLL